MHETFLCRIIKNRYLSSLENEAWIKVLRFHIHSTCIDNRSDRPTGNGNDVLLSRRRPTNDVDRYCQGAKINSRSSILLIPCARIKFSMVKSPCWILGSFDGRPIWTLFCRGRVISTQLPVAAHLRASSFGHQTCLVHWPYFNAFVMRAISVTGISNCRDQFHCSMLVLQL